MRLLTDFVVPAVREAAQRAIEQGDVVRLSLAKSEHFAQAVLTPPNPSPALECAFARRRKGLYSRAYPRLTSRFQAGPRPPYRADA